MLGEQGWPGFVLWIWLQLSGLWQMERLRRQWRASTAAADRWKAPLAEALFQAQVVFLVGSLFVGIAYQPFFLLLIALQCALWSYLRRTGQGEPVAAGRKAAPRGLVVPAAAVP